MFKNRSQKKNKSVGELLDFQRAHLEWVDKQFVEIESIKDLTEKIPALEELINIIHYTKNNGTSKMDDIVGNYAAKKSLEGVGVGAVAGAAAVAVPVALLCPPVFLILTPYAAFISAAATGAISGGRAEKSKKKKLLKQNPDINDFQSAMTAHIVRAREMKHAALVNLQKEYLEQFDKKLIDVEQMKDPAKKILTLQGLINDDSMGRQLLDEYFERAYFEHDSFEDLMAQKTAQAKKMLDEIIRTCSLDAVALSPSYAEVFDSFPPLRERFREAAVESAKRTQQEPSVSGQTPLKLLKSNRPGV